MSKLKKRVNCKKTIAILVLIISISFFFSNTIKASDDPCNSKMSVQQCIKAIEKKQKELKIDKDFKAEKELDIYAKNLMSNKNELKNWYIQFNLDTFFMPTGTMSDDLLNILSNLDLHLSKLVAFIFNMISFFIYYITMFFVNFVNGNTISNLITGIGKYINNDILNINSDSGLGVKIIFTIMMITLIRSLATRDGNVVDLKSFLKYFVTLLFVAIFAIQMARVNVAINKTINSITKPVITSLVNDEKLAQNDIKGATLEQKLKNIIYENISLSQYVFQNFGTTTNKVSREEVRKLMVEKNYADVLAEKGNVYVISNNNKENVLYYTTTSSLLRLANTMSGSFLQVMLQTYQLTFKVIAELIPIFSFIYIAINLSKGFMAITRYFFTVGIWSIMASVVGFIILIINLVISYTYNQFFGINYFATLLFSIFMLIIAIWLFRNRRMIFGFVKKLVEGQINLGKAALMGSPIMDSINTNVNEPLKEIGSDLKNHFAPTKTEVSGEVQLKSDEDDTSDTECSQNTNPIDDEVEATDLIDDGQVDNDEESENTQEESVENNTGSNDDIQNDEPILNDESDIPEDNSISDNNNDTNLESDISDLVDDSPFEYNSDVHDTHNDIENEDLQKDNEKSFAKQDNKEYLNNIDTSLINSEETEDYL